MVVRIDDILSENTTVVEAHQFPVKAVKLFQGSDRAEVIRKFPLSFLRSQGGPQVVEIVELPASIQSVDVSITSTSGNVTILDHYRTQASVSQPPDSAVSSQMLRELEAEQKRLEDEKSLRQQSLTFFTTYMDSLAQCKSRDTQPEATQMVTLFDEFIVTGATRSAAIAELDSKLDDIDNKIIEETKRLAKLSYNLPVKVVVVLSCNSQVPVEAAELTVTYVVKQVDWHPAYDIHVTMAGNVPSPTVKLDFRCTVMQWTGENWENISLALTTANQVSQLIQLPEPKRVNISLGPTSVLPGQIVDVHDYHDEPKYRRYPRYCSPEGDRHREYEYDDYDEPKYKRYPRYYSPEGDRHRECEYEAQLANPRRRRRRSFTVQPPPAMPPQPQDEVIFTVPAPPMVPADLASLASDVSVDGPSQTISQLIHHDGKDPITHIANASIFIPSDRAEHHVLVASFPLQAEFMRVVVPSIDTRVYYTCEVKNTSEYVLLPGTVKTYLNDKHVSSTEIHSTDLPQILECSLAVDTGVKTMHNRAPDALPSATAFTGKATTTYTSATMLHNMHTEAIRGVIVRSSIPLPADPRITIVLKEPAGLAEMDEGSVSVKEGCLARWSTTGGRKGKQMGLFEWVCDMNPGTEMLKAVWEVCAPQDLKLLEQERT